MPYFVIGQQAALDGFVLLAPAEEGLDADRVMVESQWGLAGLSAFDKVAVHVPFSEAPEGDVVIGRPARELADLDFIVALGLLRAGGLEVEEELVERFLPGKGRNKGGGSG